MKDHEMEIIYIRSTLTRQPALSNLSNYFKCGSNQLKRAGGNGFAFMLAQNDYHNIKLAIPDHFLKIILNQQEIINLT